MTPAVHEYVKKLGLTGKTLDVGSFSVNGNVRDLFNDYAGVDMRSGPNVDMVCNSHVLPFCDDFFDNVLCLEMLEHDDYPFDSIAEMKRVLRPGGVMVLTVPTIGFQRHDYPSDYWRFTVDGVKVLLRGLTEIQVREDQDHVYGMAKKLK